MSQFYSQRAGHQLMVCGLVFDLLLILSFFETQPRPHKRRMQDHIDFIEGEPMGHIISIPLKQYPAKTQITADHPPVPPSAVFLNQVNGTIKMRDRHQWTNMIFSAFFKYIFIEQKPFFLRRFFLPVRKDSGPCDTHPIYLKSHLSHQTNIFPEPMVKVNAFCRRISVLLIHPKHFFMSCNHIPAVRTRRTHIHIGKTSSAF